MHERVPGRHRRARQSGCLFEAQMCGHRNDATLIQCDVLSEHSIYIAAQRALDLLCRRRTFDPVLKEAARDAISDSKARNGVSDGDDFACAVRKGNAWQLHFWVVGTFDNHQIPIIQGDSAYTNKYLIRRWRGGWPVNQREI